MILGGRGAALGSIGSQLGVAAILLFVSENPTRLCLAGSYQPTIDVAGSYQPTIDVAGSYQSTIDVAGSWEDC